jgi:hypothetical protein
MKYVLYHRLSESRLGDWEVLCGPTSGDYILSRLSFYFDINEDGVDVCDYKIEVVEE